VGRKSGWFQRRLKGLRGVRKDLSSSSCGEAQEEEGFGEGTEKKQTTRREGGGGVCRTYPPWKSERGAEDQRGRTVRNYKELVEGGPDLVLGGSATFEHCKKGPKWQCQMERSPACLGRSLNRANQEFRGGVWDFTSLGGKKAKAWAKVNREWSYSSMWNRRSGNFVPYQMAEGGPIRAKRGSVLILAGGGSKGGSMGSRG